MSKKVKTWIVLIGAIAFAILGIQYLIGWVMGWAALYVLNAHREKFYNNIFGKNFSAKSMVGYSFRLLVILFLPLLMAFLMPNKANPYTYICAIFTERLHRYIMGMFKGAQI